MTWRKKIRSILQAMGKKGGKNPERILLRKKKRKLNDRIIGSVYIMV